MTEKKIGIVLLPDPATARAAAALSRRIAPVAKAPELILDAEPGSIVMPHLTLFHLLIEEGRVGELARVIDAAIDPHRHGIVHGTLDKIKRYGNGEWVFWCTALGSQLQRLHEVVCDAAAPLRCGDISDEDAFLVTDWRWKAVRTWGFSNCGHAYVPHITVSYVPKACRLPCGTHQTPPQHWASSTIAIGELGPHGTFMKVLHRLTLQRHI